MNKFLIIIICILSITLIFGIVFVYRYFPFEESANKKFKTGILYKVGDSFVTNVQGSDELLKTDIVIEIDDKDIEKILESNNAKIRDRILAILCEVSEEDIRSTGYKDKLKADIKNDLQNTLQIDGIRNIYFSEFVMQ